MCGNIEKCASNFPRALCDFVKCAGLAGCHILEAGTRECIVKSGLSKMFLYMYHQNKICYHIRR